MYRYPDSHVFYRKLGHEYPCIVRGEGCWLVDDRGKRYLDAVGGAGSGEPLIRLAEVEALLAGGWRDQALASLASAPEVVLGRLGRIGDASLRQSHRTVPEVARILALALEMLD